MSNESTASAVPSPAINSNHLINLDIYHIHFLLHAKIEPFFASLKKTKTSEMSQAIINMGLVFGIVQLANKFQLDAPENAK